MTSLISYYYYDYWNQAGDPRVAKYPFMNGGPWLTLALIGAYVYISNHAGRQYMKNRPAFDLKRPILGYNICLILLNLYIFLHGMYLTNFGSESWNCTRVNRTSTSKSDMRKIFVGWLYFVSKFIDFMDTFFFVLRKKDSHLSFLHLYHHSVMPLFSWLGLKFAPGGNTAFLPLINSLVHVVMYSYYALSTFPNLRPYLWWKRYLTQMQLVQFVLIMIHSIYSMMNPVCEWPRFLIYLSTVNGLLFFHLFYSFFKRSYQKPRVEIKINDKTE